VTSSFEADTNETQTGRIRVRRVGKGKPCLIMLSGAFPGETYLLEPGAELTVGRAPGNDVRIRQGDVSRVQARIKVSESGKVELTDLGSTNGTFINGRRQLFRALREGDKIQFGEKTVFRFAFYDELDRDFQERLFGASVLDQETGTLSRERLKAVLADEFASARSEERDLAVVVMAVDGFSVLVDLLGYAVRDYFLRELCWVIRRSVAGEAALYRLGESSFATLLPGMDLEHATEAAERIRRAVAHARLTYRGDRMQFSLALGAGSLVHDGPGSPESLLTTGEERLERAARAGGDRVETASEA
jgi:diguanylate cyclase (GGDEF)-like protein